MPHLREKCQRPGRGAKARGSLRDITNIWNAVIVSHVGTHYVIQMAPWNGTIDPGGAVTFGFQASGAGRTPTGVSLHAT
jgi:hypothetical protein